MSWLCGPAGSASGSTGAIVRLEDLGFPFETDSPFLFAVYHLDRFPRGNGVLGPDASLSGHSIGADFGNPAGWSMYHGKAVPGFPKHPHRGFETVTITRQGFVDHADSLGNQGRFGNGDVQWMTARRGIEHGEMFPLLDQDNENVLELFQVWLNLPRKSKMVEPGYRMLWHEDVPKAFPNGGSQRTGATGGVELTLIGGELSGMNTPPPPPPNSYAVDPASDLLILTVQLAAGASWTLPRYSGPRPLDGLNRNVYFFAGQAARIDGVSLAKHKRVKVRPDVDLELAAEDKGPVDVLVLQGRDIGEPVVQHGPFVMTSREEIKQAMIDFQRGQFGDWQFSSGSVVHSRASPRFMKYGDGTSEERPR